jgi:hypothetical protein
MLNQISGHKLKPFLALLLTFLTACTVTAMMWRGGFTLRMSAGDRSATPVVVKKKSTQPRQGKIGYIAGHMLWPSLREPFRIMAARLEKPGAELIIFTGSLSRLKSQRSAPVPVRVILAHPNQLRLEEVNKVTVFDGSSLSKVGDELTDDDADEIESLLLDYPERLFVGQVSGNPVTQLGSRFRADDGSTPNYKGPYYDVYKMAEGLNITASPAVSEDNREFTIKRYYINSDTHLIERIAYERRRGRTTKVEVKLDDWRTVEKQKMPFSVTRLEDGTPTLRFKVNAAVIANRIQ